MLVDTAESSPRVEASAGASSPAVVSTAAADLPRRPRGLGLTLFSNHGPRVALLEALGDLAAIRPQAVMVHGGPRALVQDLRMISARLQSMLPGVVLWVGVQWDGWISNYAAARTDRERAAVVKVYVDAARMAADCGAVGVVWDCEGKAEAMPGAARALERACVAQTRAARPDLLQALTTFDQPGVHGSFPWSGWLGDAAEDRSPVDLWMPQVYASPGDGTLAGARALTKRLDAHRTSTARVKALGWIRRDMDELLYFQGHHVPRVQTAFHGAREGFVFVWAAPKKTATVDGRLDGDGLEACRVLAELARERPVLEGLDASAVAAWCQGALSVLGLLAGEGDGVFGPKSLAAARSLGWVGSSPDAALVSLLRDKL